LELAQVELLGRDRNAAQSRAEALMRRALALDPSFAGAYLNLADHLRELGRDADASAVLEEGLRKSRDHAPLEHALGLSWVRRGDKARGLEHLAKAYRLAPDSGRMGYVYAVALFDTGRRDQAIAVLEKLHQRLPGDLATLDLLARYGRSAGPRPAPP
jgi:predicted Zn-dependent protease